MGAVTYPVGLLVLPGATELDLTLHLELFRVANGLLNKTLFCVDILTVDNRDVALANGRVVAPTTALNPQGEYALAVILSHVNPAPALLASIHVAVRKLANASVLVAAADQAPLILASAGMLNGKVVTCHVDLMHAARESYPSVEFIDRLWIRDGNILTYPGHLSTVDTITEYIGGLLGEEFAEALSVELISASPREPRSSQRSTKKPLEGINERRVIQAIEIMRSNIESPLSIPDVAKEVGVSTRSLESLWRNELGSSPQIFYMRERVNHSCSLLLFSKLSITQISCACGFSSGASFSRAFTDLTGASPREYRRQHGNKIAPAVLLKERGMRSRDGPAGEQLSGDQAAVAAPAEAAAASPHSKKIGHQGMTGVLLREEAETGTRTVPEQMIGCWKRHSITFPNGAVDRETRVIWLQTASGVADIRISAERPDLRHREGFESCTKEELLALAEQDCFCATTLFDPTVKPYPMAIWPPELDIFRFQPVASFPEPGWLEWRDDETVMLEYAPSGAYEEDWRLLETEPEVSIHLVKSGAGISDCLYVTGNHAIRARGRRHSIAQKLPLADVARSLGNDLKAIREMLDCEFSYARRDATSDRYTIELSTFPWLEGQEMGCGWVTDIAPRQILACDPHGNTWKVETLWSRNGTSRRGT